MEHKFLLTYRIGTQLTYQWFNSEEEMQDFLDVTYVDEINDAIEIPSVRTLDVELNNE